MEIVSRGSIKTLPPHKNIQLTVLSESSNKTVVTVISQQDYSVDFDKLRLVVPEMEMNLVSSDQDLLALCGFPRATLPPLIQPIANNNREAVTMTILDQSLLAECTDQSLLLLGNAGYPLWKSLLSTDFLLHQPHTMVADVACKSNVDTDTDNDDAFPPLLQSGSGGSPSTTSSHTLDEPRPYFPIDGPPMELARLVTQQHDLSNPFRAVTISVVGRIGWVKSRTKKAMTCEFLPPNPIPSFKKKRKRDIRDNDDAEQTIDNHPLPWRSVRNDRPMMVELSFGKTTEPDFDIQCLQEGQWIHIDARTNPTDRASLQKWVDDQCLDMLVVRYQILHNRLDDTSKEQQGDITNTSGDSSSSASLSLDNLNNNTISVNIVDDFDSLAMFEMDLLRQLDCLDKNSSALVGLDCEWQPSEFAKSKHLPQPVLLLQISLHSLHTVYLLDLQTLLRPLQSLDTALNEIESKVSDSLERLFRSSELIKVGYQLSSDLSRMAASYPHIPCFQRIDSVLEVASLIKTALQISKQKKSRYITMSLASIITHYLGMSVDKDCQLSDWAARPLSFQQMQYAALDAAVVPVLAERSMESIGAYVTTFEKDFAEASTYDESIQATVPILKRDSADTRLSKEILSWHFVPLQKGTDDEKIVNLQAKNMVGQIWIASSNWGTGQRAPATSAMGSRSGK
jgi:3'-5' exonuclease